MESKNGREMLPLRFCLVGTALILLAAGALWLTGLSKITDPFVMYPFVAFDDFEPAFFCQFLILAIAGTGLLFLWCGIWSLLARKTLERRLPRILPELPLRNVTAWNKRSSSPSLIPAMLNAFSVSWICVLMNLLIIFMMFGPRPPHGLRIEWKERSPVFAAENPWARTMSVYIKHPGRFYINGIAVKRAEFETKLGEELSHRAEWTVYVEADNDTAFMDTVYAIDTIQGLGARVMWITPGLRRKWRETNDLYLR